MSARKFDLNIEKILENWEVHHAIREIIANAMDEEILTGCKPLRIFKDDKRRWRIRDYGRCHATSGASDITDGFEQELTSLIGKLTEKVVAEKRG